MQVETKAGIGGGLLMSLLSLNYENLFHTVVYAAAGAVVSFTVPLVLRCIRGMIRNRLNR